MHSFQPIAARHYFSLPTAAGVGLGIGASWLASAANVPGDLAAPLGFCVGVSAVITTALVAVQAISAERAEYWKYRRMLLENPLIRPPEPEPEPEPEPLEPGLQPIRRNEKGQIIGYASEVYLPGDEGWTEIFHVRVSHKQLERLHEVVLTPRKDNRIAIVYDDFIRGENKVFSNGEFKKFQRQLADEHMAWWGRGSRLYLTERGRRVVLQKWSQINNKVSVAIRR
jgi:hypothetical protein